MDSIKAIDKRINQLNRLKATILELLPNGPSRRRKAYENLSNGPVPRAKRILSANARARISAAQKTRWLKWKKANAK